MLRLQRFCGGDGGKSLRHCCACEPRAPYVILEETLLPWLNCFTEEWDQLCPIFDSLTPSQLGGGGRYSYEEAANISTLLFPPSRLPY
jgi:hypothetical protein